MFLLFGNSVNSSDWGQVAGQESKFAQAFNLSQEYLSHRGRLGPFYWLLNDKAFRGACKTCHDFMDKGIAKALEAFVHADHGGKGEDRDADTYVFVEALMQQTRDPRVLRDQCLNVLLAGRDTTACCLHWTLYGEFHHWDMSNTDCGSRLLARHQHILDKLRREIDQISGLGSSAPLPTREDLRRMSYLQLVIKEGMLSSP
ncbi:hypothetical protein MHUMG1_09049 [Metarhizium humberi]|uniref:Cytochrome P450 n=1 Tax=Metarhizium humberi TaxID=2596975 RepID=A0A9P8S433_9HYPO|nr:hypothetical protein MHUMG1_09049 [Metarhizium humberi]